jgi:hypothetical protein
MLVCARYLIVCTQYQVQFTNTLLLVEADVWEVLMTKDAWQIQLSKFPNIYVQLIAVNTYYYT